MKFKAFDFALTLQTAIICAVKNLNRLLPILLLSLVIAPLTLRARAQTSSSEVDSVFPDSRALYLDIHQAPELSSHEIQTAAKLASRLRALGYDVTEHVGGTGIVAIMKNGDGPKVMLRTELDALPVEEKTGLPYASKVHTKDESGREVGVMHACGHDIHMASIIGTATIMARTKNSWHGTLILIGQPAEETITGAKAMIADGLFTRFPKPDYAIALHVDNKAPAGRIGVGSGYRYAAADSVRVTIYGRGGHGSMPQATIDPVLIAARTVVSLQSIVSREVTPGDVAVVTVGYINAGTKNNIIPDTAQLGITVRTYKPEVRKKILASIGRIVKAESEAGGADREPLIEYPESTDAVYNDPALAARLRAPLEAALGKENVLNADPITGSEDFSFYTKEGIPTFYYELGGADPQKFAEAAASGQPLPSNHSSLFAPDLDPALHTGITSELAILRSLLSASS
jgi:amidohydrolase